MIYNILLIEDNKEMAENISEVLQLAGYNVMYGSNGKEGVDLALQNHPDLILCDIMMPELDGYGVAHIVNADPETADIPFVFLTSKADMDDFRKGMDLGADDYITKPFNDVDLLRIIEMRIKKKQILKSRISGNSENVSSFFSKTKEIKEFRKLSENRKVRFFRKRDIIFMEGQIPNDLYYIEKGKIKTYKVNHDGKELITGIYGAGNFLGYVPLFEEKAYNENAEALEEVEISVIPKADFFSILYSSKEVAKKFIEMLSVNLDQLEDRLLDIAYLSIRQRVAGALVKIYDTFQPSKKSDVITITRRDISNIVGTAIESLNRTLGDFRDEQLIELSGDGIKIINRHKLEHISH